MFTIIIPTSNASSYIKYALDSILQQDVEETLEVIIVDDFSDDRNELESIINNYMSRLNIIFILNDKKTNGAVCRNIGLDKASGDYICFLDADDYWSNNKLREGKNLLESSNKRQVIYTSINRGTRDEILNGNFIKLPTTLKDRNVKLCDYWWIDNGVTQTSSLMYRRNDFHSIRFNPNLVRHQDYDFCLKLEHAGAEFIFDKQSTTYWVILEPTINAASKGASLKFCISWLTEYKEYLTKKGIEAYISKNMLLISIKNKEILDWVIYVSFKQKYSNCMSVFLKSISILIKKSIQRVFCDNK